MSADSGQSGPWYQPPTDPGPYDWPADLSAADDSELAGYPARQARQPGAAPTLYRADTLVAPAASIDDQAFARLSAELAPLSWSLAPGPRYRDEIVLRIVVSRSRFAAPQVPAPRAATEAAGAERDGGALDAGDSPDALRALDFLRDRAATDPALRPAVDALRPQRLSFVGMPAMRGHAGTEREALVVLGGAPPRRGCDQVPGGRRPVVALLDSGIGVHPWLAGPQGDPFWIDARTLGWVSTAVGPVPNRAGGDLGPTGGQPGTHAGHGTFIAGLIRQLAPDARVLSMPLMSADGVLEEQPVLDALYWLLDRLRGAAGDPARFVDIVSLSFGYYEERPGDDPDTTRLRQVLGELGELGVRVLASAGNHANAAPVYPAAFAGYAPAPRTALLSVGALNPDGSQADYSNFGDWVLAWAPGTALVSAMPKFGHPAQAATEAYDPGNLLTGFARWSGTSFATGVAAAQLARALCDQAAGPADLLDVSPAEAHRRAELAYEAVRGSLAPAAVPAA